MQDVNLKQLLLNYTTGLCDKRFIFSLPKDKKISIVFFRESLCHLMGLQHVFNYDAHYLGGKGYKKILEESVTVETLKKHNKKQYGFIKERLRHFDEILHLLRYGEMVCFIKEKVRGGTYIKADLVIYNTVEKYILHLFLRKEKNTDIYTPISYVVQTENDKEADKFLKGQRRLKIIAREEVKIHID